MIDSKKGNKPFILGFHPSLENFFKKMEERENMRKVPYASVVGSLMYTMSISDESRTNTLTSN